MRWTEDDLKMVQERIKHGSKNNTAVQVAVMERDSRHEHLAAQKIKRLGSRCDIHLLSRRHRLIDMDNLSEKAVLDGLRHSGFLRDDGPEEVQSVTHSQEKISRKENEETIITIAWAENHANSPVDQSKPKKRTTARGILSWD